MPLVFHPNIPLSDVGAAQIGALFQAVDSRRIPGAGLCCTLASGGTMSRGDIHALGQRHGLDTAVLASRRCLADFKLMVFDMDSTLINIECIDELAEDRKSVVSGKSVSVRLDLGGRRIISKKQTKLKHT